MITTLIAPETLAAHLGDPDFVAIDCRYSLDDESWGRREYLARHVPGAGYAHLSHDLAGARTGANGRHPLPDPATLTGTFGRLGIGHGTQVVAYDQDTGMYASRLWWLLRWLGHEAVAVLDGGFARWVAEGRPTSAGEERPREREFTGTPRPGQTVTADEVSAAIGRGELRLIDARAPERYRGETEPIDRVAGHIPGALNHFFKWNLDERGRFRSPEAIRDALGQTIGDVPPERIVSYCGSGVTACHNLLAFEHAGMHGAKLYPGSWSEWSSDPSRPVERTDHT
jgi:thiosulfate/3-mercaptopyruvate sulfurtransferase